MSSRFLEFSLRFYGRPGVAPACLALQEKNGIDVNMLLFAFWAASTGGRLDEAAVATAHGITNHWQETVVRPLRSVRRSLSHPPGLYDPAASAALRQTVKDAELKSEFLQQDAMEAGCPLPPSELTAMRLAKSNVASYAAYLGRHFDQSDLSSLMVEFAEYLGLSEP